MKPDTSKAGRTVLMICTAALLGFGVLVWSLATAFVSLLTGVWKGLRRILF